jgi:hypothetical protein
VVRVVTGEAEVEVTEQRAHDVEFGVTVKERATVEVNRFAMPGWEWRVNGERVGENLTRSNEGKLMHEFDEPGEYRVQVLFGKTRVRWVAEALSVLGLAGVGWWVKSRR